jgi:hypothetical protein
MMGMARLGATLAAAFAVHDVSAIGASKPSPATHELYKAVVDQSKELIDEALKKGKKIIGRRGRLQGDDQRRNAEER